MVSFKISPWIHVQDEKMARGLVSALRQALSAFARGKTGTFLAYGEDPLHPLKVVASADGHGWMVHPRLKINIWRGASRAPKDGEVFKSSSDAFAWDRRAEFSIEEADALLEALSASPFFTSHARLELSMA